MIEEIWKDIPKYKGFYMASSKGRIKRVDKDRIMKQSIAHGYKKVALSKKGVAKCFMVHRLIVMAFLKNPLNKEYVNHKNGTRIDNRIENLEWCSPEENSHHAHINNLMQWKDRLNPVKVKKARALYVTGKYSQRCLAKRFGVTQGTMNFCLRRLTWKSI